MDTQPTIARAVLGGIAGTAAMTAMMYMVAPPMGLHMDIAVMLGSVFGGSWVVGMTAHLINGAVIFPVAYALVFYAQLPGTPLARGTTLGVLLWLVAQTMVMPMMGAGVFSASAGGMMAAAASLAGHVVYGSLLGLVASSPAPQLAGA